MATIQKILKDGEVVYPITKPECVIDERGKNVLQLIKENGGGEGSYDDTEIRQELTELSSEVDKKVNKTDIATINGQSITEGGNIIIEGGEGVISTSTKGTGKGSLVQTKEVETFENQAPITENPNEEISVDAIGDNSTVLNGKSHAGAKRALAHGNRTIALGENSHTEGHCTQVMNFNNDANGYAAHAEGYGNIAAGTYSHAEGNTNIVLASNAHAEGKDTRNCGDSSHTEGYGTFTGSNEWVPPDRPVIDDSTSGVDSSTGDSGASISTTDGIAAHAEGNYTRAHGNYSHAEGRQCDTWGEGSHAEGTETVANGDYSHAEGNKSKTYNPYSHAEGVNCVTEAAGSHAEGWESSAKGEYSHSEGQYTRAHGTGSHSEGNNTDAYAPYSHAEGIGTKTNPDIIGQHVEGYYNAESDSLKIVGCGTSNEDRKNAVEVTQDGRVFLKGVGNYDGTSLEVKDLATVINEGGQGGESSVFKAIYGVTTYEEVSEAYNQGKIIHCDYESRCYELAVFTGNIAWFSCLNTTTSFLLMLNADSSWSKASYGLENAGNRVDTIKADAKPYQYPSAKAVYDFVNNTLGTLINGDY